MNNWKEQLKRAWDENPMTVIGAGTGIVLALGKIIETISSAQSRNAYRRDVDRRIKKTR